LQKFKNIDSENTYRLTSFILSSIHAVFAIFGWLHMTLISCNIPGKTYYTEKICLDFTSPGMELIITAHLSYFLNDIFSLRPIFGNVRLTKESFVHHMVGIIGLLSALILGRIVGVLAICIMITELSTIFLNNRSIMKELSILDDPNHAKFFLYNGVMLVITFFLSRIVYLAIIIVGYVLPSLFYYDYEGASKEIGWVKVKWVQTPMIGYFMLYIMNVYWFYKIL
jgi:hypothetical protein